MKEASARLLRLLTLLQTRREWSGEELADRLGVSTRTLRRDVDKLRDLDYPVRAAMGPGGGYRLGAGAKLPPLLLDDEEAMAVAVGLRTATGGGVAGIGEASLRALVKLEQVLPSHLRHRLQALQVATVEVPGMPAVDAEVLTAVATACRDRQRLRFDYRSHRDAHSVRDTEPHQLVAWGRRWYLVAWDLERDDWRTFRVDRMRPRIPTGPRFAPRELPGGDAAAYVTRGVARMWPYRPRSGCTPAPRHARRGCAPPTGASSRSTSVPACCTSAPTPRTRSPSCSGRWRSTSTSRTRRSWPRSCSAWRTGSGAPRGRPRHWPGPTGAEGPRRAAERVPYRPPGRAQGSSSTSTVPPLRQYTFSERDPEGAGSSARSRKPSSTR
jgi:predicted DNA-binding transcriptional regulator YafY